MRRPLEKEPGGRELVLNRCTRGWGGGDVEYDPASYALVVLVHSVLLAFTGVVQIDIAAIRRIGVGWVVSTEEGAGRHAHVQVTVDLVDSVLLLNRKQIC